MECITVTCNPKEQKGVSNVKRWVGGKRGRWEEFKKGSVHNLHLLKKIVFLYYVHVHVRELNTDIFLIIQKLLLVCVFCLCLLKFCYILQNNLLRVAKMPVMVTI